MMPDRHHAVARVLDGTPASTAYLTHVDPRLRVVAALVLSIVVAMCSRLGPIFVALAAAMCAIGLAGLSPRQVLKRMMPLEFFLLLLCLLLPLTARTGIAMSPGRFGYTHEGLVLAGLIVVRANALVLGLLVLVGTMDATQLGHALAHLYVPQKLSHLFLFTLRYLDLLHREYLRLRSAMRLRCFRPRMNRHTYRSYGYLVGMLLVRSFDRSARILAAMKCRGFRGQFWMLDHFHFHARRDLPFCAAAMGLTALILVLEWI